MTKILMGGTSKFTDTKLATTETKKILKKLGVKTKDLIVYGYEDSFEGVGAYSTAKEVAKSLGAEFLDGNVPKERGTSFKVKKEQRDIKMAKECDLLINLAVGWENGGKGILDTFALHNKPIECINSYEPEEKKEKVLLTPAQRRKGEIPNKEDVEKSIKIYSQIAKKLIESRCLMIDTETTGLSSTDEVVEIAIGDCYTGIIVFESLIKPSVPMNEGASKANGITDAMLNDAPTIDSIWSRVEAIVGNRVVLASHSTSEVEWFDEKLLNQSLFKHGLTCSFIWKDLQPLYRLYSCQLSHTQYPLRTDGMCLQMGVTMGTHRASDDVIAQIGILKAMAEGVYPDFSK